MVKLDHLSLAVSDLRKSRDWYVKHLGFEVEFEVPSGGRLGLGAAAIQDDSGFNSFLGAVTGTKLRLDSAPILYRFTMLTRF